MEKSVYSLVLSDAVIAAIDRAAYQQNTSRSALINRILADYVSYTTPEQRMAEIFQNLEALVAPQADFQVLQQPSDAMFSLKSLLRYKYKPTVRYSVELYPSMEAAAGVFRVALRTQSAAFLEDLAAFFAAWVATEQAFLGRKSPRYAISGAKLERPLRLTRPAETVGSRQLGEAIADYIRLFDKALKLYFEHSSRAAVGTAMESLYRAYLQKQPLII